MSNDKILTDDYVAGLMSQEANDCSLKYSAMGMEAFRPRKKPAIKPNTRFLRHIIKDTDNHNKSLLAKEAAESQARLRDLEHAEEVKRRKTNPNSKEIRRRQMGDIHAILGGKKRKRNDDFEDAKPSSQDSLKIRGAASRNPKEPSSTQVPEKSRSLIDDRSESKRNYGRLSRHESDDENEGKRRRDERRSKRSHDLDRSEERGEHRHGRSRRDRSRSPGRHSSGRRRRSRSPTKDKGRYRHRSPVDSRERARKDTEEAASGSEDELIGPAPPPKYRGRGTIGGSSGIDRRFSDTYDPKTDVQMSDEENGKTFDDLVQAYRNRKKSEQIHGESTRASESSNLQTMTSLTTEKDEASVRWAQIGETREWDKSKEAGWDDDE